MSQSPVKDVLRALNRHASVVELALNEVLQPQRGAEEAEIQALRQVSALRPVGEDGYRLHPKLREYLQDHLQLFPAFQSLADIGAKITLIRSLWDEIEPLRGDLSAAQGMLLELQTTVLDIGDAMDRNMVQLHMLMSTRYGNVDTRAEKKAQNNYYQHQSRVLDADLQRLAREAERIERESGVRGREELARFMRRHVLSRLMAWQQGLSDMQTFLRNEIYRLRVIEEDHKLLARTDMLLRQQPGWAGFEADLSGDVPDFLLAAQLAQLRAHVEPMEADKAMVTEMQALARALPPRAAPAPAPQAPVRYTRVVDAPVERPPTPAIQALGRLMRDVAAADEAISLLAWQRTDPDAVTLAPRIWLVLALAALRARRLTVDLVRDPPREGERFSHTFHDARVAPARGARRPAPAGVSMSETSL